MVEVNSGVALGFRGEGQQFLLFPSTYLSL